MIDVSVRLSGCQPRLVPVSLDVPRLCAGLDGKRLLFLTDVHYSHTFPRRSLLRLIDTIAGIAPDMLLLGGDYGEDIRRTRDFITEIARIAPPMGAFAVPGNNDYEAFQGRYERMREWMAESGIRFLLNERVAMPVTGGRFVLTGIDESKFGSPDPRAYLPPQDGDFSVLLAHSPWALDAVFANAANLAHLSLCGHTHGGQIALGCLGPYRIGYERLRHGEHRSRRFFFVTGTHVVDGMTVIVSNGVGTSLLPIRIGAMPQMHIITLGQREK